MITILKMTSETKNNNVNKYKQSLEEWKNYIQPIVRNPFLKDPDYFAEISRL